MTDLTTRALSAAASGLWLEAIDLNLAIILKENRDDVEALNRLAHAYKELGQIKNSQTAYRKVLKLDRFNQIASKNLKFLKALPKNFKKTSPLVNAENMNETFLEEPGKTKIISLINLAPLSVLMGLSCGSRANLVIKRRTVTVLNHHNLYLGALPDDLSAKLMRLINGGNRYEVFVKTVARKNLTVFIRELFRSSRFKSQPTFPVTNANHLYHEDELKMSSLPEEKSSDEESSDEEEV